MVQLSIEHEETVDTRPTFGQPILLTSKRLLFRPVEQVSVCSLDQQPGVAYPVDERGFFGDALVFLGDTRPLARREVSGTVMMNGRRKRPGEKPES